MSFLVLLVRFTLPLIIVYFYFFFFFIFTFFFVFPSFFSWFFFSCLVLEKKIFVLAYITKCWRHIYSARNTVDENCLWEMCLHWAGNSEVKGGNQVMYNSKSSLPEYCYDKAREKRRKKRGKSEKKLKEGRRTESFL